MSRLHVTVLVPVRVADIGAEQAARGVSPEQTSNAALERPVVQRAGPSIELEAPLPAQRNRERSLDSREAFLIEGPPPAFKPAVDAVIETGAPVPAPVRTRMDRSTWVVPIQLRERSCLRDKQRQRCRRASCCAETL